jgi:hypothetical protein
LKGVRLWVPWSGNGKMKIESDVYCEIKMYRIWM